MYWSVECADEVPFNSYDRALANAQSVRPELREWAVQFINLHFAVCGKWGVPSGGQIETIPVVSTIPTLIMSSANDHVTPPRYAEALTQSLSRSYLVRFPPVGHAALFQSESCGFIIAYTFINTPTREPRHELREQALAARPLPPLPCACKHRRRGFL